MKFIERYITRPIMNFIEKSKTVLRTILIRQTYCRVFGTVDGKDVLRDICRLGLVTKSIYSDNPQRAAFNEGKRMMAMTILSRAVQDPQSFISKHLEEEPTH